MYLKVNCKCAFPSNISKIMSSYVFTLDMKRLLSALCEFMEDRVWTLNLLFHYFTETWFFLSMESNLLGLESQRKWGRLDDSHGDI